LLNPIIINFRSDRKKPPYEKLRSLEDPERFMWHILPHAARTFSLSIVFLPRRLRPALAVAYLYCRMLDTYEDLLPEAAAKGRALRSFIDRFAGADEPGPAPALDPALSDDPRERTHLLLVNRAHLVDRVFAGLTAGQREAIRRLVRRMGEGMLWSSRVMDDQGGVLRSPEQLSRYCWNVLGTPLLFAQEVQRLDQGLPAEVPAARLRSCARVGEMIQLANITRDLEKDRERGVCYHPELAGDDGAPNVRRIRAQLVLRALRLAAECRPFVESIPAPRVSLARGGAVMMLLTTFSYYHRAAQKAGLPAFEEAEKPTRLGGGLTWARCVFSRKATSLFLARLETRTQAAFSRCRPPRSERFVYDDGDWDATLAGVNEKRDEVR